jgi:hypothetical protein
VFRGISRAAVLGLGLAVLANIAIAPNVMATASSPRWGAAWGLLPLPLSTLQPLGANVPTQIKFKDDGSGSAGVFAYRFDDETAINENQVGFILLAPRSWLEGTAVMPVVYSTPEDTTVCNYRVCVEYVISTNGDFPTNTSTVCETFASAASASANQKVLIDGPADTELDVTGTVFDGIIIGRLYRNSGHAEDTCNAKYLLIHGLGIRYRIDRPGTRTRTTK